MSRRPEKLSSWYRHQLAAKPDALSWIPGTHDRNRSGCCAPSFWEWTPGYWDHQRGVCAEVSGWAHSTFQTSIPEVTKNAQEAHGANMSLSSSAGPCISLLCVLSTISESVPSPGWADSSCLWLQITSSGSSSLLQGEWGPALHSSPLTA